MLKNVKEKMNMIEKQMEYPNVEINIIYKYINGNSRIKKFNINKL